MKRDQYKHYKNSSEYVQGKSYLTVDETELKSIVKQNIGKGLPLVDKNGNWRQIENIDCGKVIGYNLDLSGNETPTQFGDIHYSKDGWHFVPTYDRRKP